MIDVVYIDLPAENCKLCGTPTLYICQGVRCCPACAATHENKDLDIPEPAGTRRKIGRPMILRYVFRCGHKIKAEDMPLRDHQTILATKCPKCGKKGLRGKYYQCHRCKKIFYKAGSRGNHLFCADCAKIQKEESHMAAHKRREARGWQNLAPRATIKRTPWPKITSIDFMGGGSNWAMADLYHTVGRKQRINKPARQTA